MSKGSSGFTIAGRVDIYRSTSKAFFLVEVGKVFVVRVLRYIVLIAEKRAHAAQLQKYIFLRP